MWDNFKLNSKTALTVSVDKGTIQEGWSHCFLQNNITYISFAVIDYDNSNEITGTIAGKNIYARIPAVLLSDGTVVGMGLMQIDGTKFFIRTYGKQHNIISVNGVVSCK